MAQRDLHLVPRLPPVGLRPVPETPVPAGSAFLVDEIKILQRLLTESPTAPVVCPRCNAPISHDRGEKNESTDMTVWSIRCPNCNGHAVVRASLNAGPEAPVFSTLVASQPGDHRVRRTAPGFATSTLVHIVLIALAARFTLGSRIATTDALADTTMVYLTRNSETTPEPEPEPEDVSRNLVVQLDQVAKGFQTVNAPMEIPTSIPPVDLGQRFDPRDYSGSGVEGGIFTGVEGGELLVDDETSVASVFKETAVDEPPERLSGPPLRYPTMLRQAGIEGQVVLEFVVGADGKAEEDTFEVLSATNVAFVAAARDLLMRSTFRPGKLRGRSVRVLVTQSISFNIVK